MPPGVDGVTAVRTLLWRRLDQPGHEAARLVWHDPFWQLSGTAVWSEDGAVCRLEYGIVCDPGWLTRHAWVTGWIGPRHVRVDLLALTDRRWHLDGRLCPAVDGCPDVDLSFTPATNMLPVRRLGLAVGQEAAVRAAWLSFPSLTPEPLGQVYRRTGPTSYHYRAGDDGFSTELEIDPDGFVRRYPGQWELEAG
jgi:uncharacterized protein